jgi:hypothetical protein
VIGTAGFAERAAVAEAHDVGRTILQKRWHNFTKKAVSSQLSAVSQDNAFG